MFPEYSIGMGSMSLSLGVLPSGDILHPPQQDKEYSLELAQHHQTCKCSAQALFYLFAFLLNQLKYVKELIERH
jgi:hypothetical protein